MGAVVQAYEERLLFLLLLLRQPRLQLIFVTGREVDEAIVDYYLALLPGVIPSQARARLHMIAAHDGSPRPLTDEAPRSARVSSRRSAAASRIARGAISCHSPRRPLERDLALALGIPLYGADPRHLHFGTKTGCRRLFEEAGVAHPLGREGITGVDGAVDALSWMRGSKPHMSRAIVKHNDGVAGRGNAVVELQGLPAPGSAEERAELRARVEQMQFEHPGTDLPEYLQRLAEDGGIVEEHIGGVELRSPSVQLRISPLGEVEVLSTHDQLLGGRSGQTYLGCRFPADFGYARAITSEATKVAERLAREGVLGRFAVDFVVVRDASGGWTPYTIELNLRKGGTTHPFLTLQFLTDGTYDPVTALFTAPSGREKHLVATDHLESELLRGLSVHDLFDIAVRHRLHFDPARQIGVVFHMMSSLTEIGRTGMTVVGDSREQADAAYRRAERVLVEEAEPSRETPLPQV